MIETKEDFRYLSRKIWIESNISKAQIDINNNLAKVINSENKSIMSYIAMKDEVDVITSISSSFRVQVPYLQRDELARCEFSTDLINDEFGFLVPKKIILPEHKPDVILVPGRFFDRRGNRIGRGGGHYDKFLKGHSNSMCIGIALDEALTKVIPYEEHDVKMDIIITEKEILYIE